MIHRSNEILSVSMNLISFVFNLDLVRLSTFRFGKEGSELSSTVMQTAVLYLCSSESLSFNVRINGAKIIYFALRNSSCHAPMLAPISRRKTLRRAVTKLYFICYHMGEGDLTKLAFQSIPHLFAGEVTLHSPCSCCSFRRSRSLFTDVLAAATGCRATHPHRGRADAVHHSTQTGSDRDGLQTTTFGWRWAQAGGQAGPGVPAERWLR